MTLEIQLKIRQICERKLLIVWEIGAERISKRKRDALRFEYKNLELELEKLDTAGYYKLERFKDFQKLAEYPEGKCPWSKKDKKLVDDWFKR